MEAAQRIRLIRIIEKTEKNLKEKISYDGLKEKLNGGSQKHRN